MEVKKMDINVMQQVLDELFPALEALETQSGAMMQFLKERGIASENDLAPFVEQAANASNVRWRAARLRIDHLLSGAAKAAEASEKKEREETKTKPDTRQDREVSEKVPEGARDSGEQSARKEKTSAGNKEKGPDAEAEVKKEEGKKKEEEKKKEESRGTEQGKPGKPASEDAA
jgi:hypothetical protein